MEIRIKELVHNLNLQYSTYQQIYQLSLEKQGVVIAEDLTRLEEITTAEGEFLAQIEKLEEERVGLCLSMKVSTIIANSDGPAQESLVKIQQDLVALLGLLQEQNSLNERLIRDALQLTNMDLNMLTSNGRPPTYGKNRQLQINQGNKNLINKKV